MLFATPSGTPVAGRRPPSLRRRLLAYVLLPSLAMMVVATIVAYVLALHYANAVHDRDLVWSTLGLSDAIEDGHSNGRLSGEARALLEFNPGGRTFYSVRSIRHGLMEGSAQELGPPLAMVAGQVPVLYDDVVAGLPVRAAAVSIWSPTEQGDRLVVSMAETLDNRHLVAREILALTLAVETVLIVALLLLMWRGVAFGLRILDAPIANMAASGRTLAPLSDQAIPAEILPLTREIDRLFERVQALLTLQERFVADAAHQLRTPLAGLAMHVERARAATSEQERQAALAHVQALTSRATRNATQLLSLARAQAPQPAFAELVRTDLARDVPPLVAARVPEAIEHGVDLGYEGECDAAPVLGQPGALQDVVDNLVDNAMRHAPPGGTITVGVHVDEDSGSSCLTVDDNGPGVPDAMLSRLGERFFRAPGAVEGGSGLGLAIVRRIAERHGAHLAFGRSLLGGLRVELRFPPTEDAR
jgi:two-component system sensor histidine kinase TctE